LTRHSASVRDEDGWLAVTRRVVDRWFALGLTFYPLVLAVQAVGVESPAAIWVALAVVAVAAVTLVAFGPAHESDEAWWFGLSTAVAFWALAVAIERGLGHPVTSRLGPILAVWAASLTVAFGVVARRRGRRTRTQDTSRR